MSPQDQPSPVPAVREFITIGRVSPARLWEFAWSADVLPRWIGANRTPPAKGTKLETGVVGDPSRSGTITKVTASSIRARLQPSPDWTGAAPTQLELSVVAVGASGARLSVTETGFVDPAHRQAARQAWRAALARLRTDLLDASRHGEKPRQAIVVFHGMGNQRPGETMQGLVRSGIIETIPDEQPLPRGIWIKPDHATGDFELRVCTFTATEGLVRPTTDVYEAYWAPEVTGTTAAMVSRWVRTLLFTWRGVPAPLNQALWLLRILVVIFGGLALAISQKWIELPPLFTTGIVVLVAGVAWKSISSWYATVLGDVARYLQPTPDNVATRRQVRKMGVDLLTSLHDSGRYDRVVVVAHSLGSVVAYDVLTALWADYHRRHQKPDSAAFGLIRAAEKLISAAGVAPDVAQDAQLQAWRQLRLNTQPWLVTDFVTVGSPLAHAPLLLRRSLAQFTLAVADRVLPSCPPTTELEHRSGHPRMSFESGYTSRSGKHRTFTQLHHAAMFGVTRWTNLYFTSTKAGLVGDGVGGPIAPVFGPWVKDVPLETTKPLWEAHTGYWAKGTTTDGSHLTALRLALHLDSARRGRDRIEAASTAPRGRHECRSFVTQQRPPTDWAECPSERCSSSAGGRGNHTVGVLVCGSLGRRKAPAV